MTETERIKIEAEAEALYMKQQQAQCGPIGYAQTMAGSQNMTPAEPSLLERISMRIDRSEREQSNLHKFHELRHLLLKNPEVARILELREEVRHLL